MAKRDDREDEWWQTYDEPPPSKSEIRLTTETPPGGWGHGRPMTLPAGPEPGQPRGMALTHENSDHYRDFWFQWLAAHGHLRTVPTPAQQADLIGNEALTPFMGNRMRARMGDEGYDALVRKQEHLARMPRNGDPRFNPEYNPWVNEYQSPSHMPPREQRPILPPTDFATGEGAISGPDISWQELMDALAARRTASRTGGAMWNGRFGGIRGGGIRGGDDALLGA